MLPSKSLTNQQQAKIFYARSIKDWLFKLLFNLSDRSDRAWGWLRILRCHDFLNATSVQTLPGCIFTGLSWLSSFVRYLADSYAGERIQILLFSELTRSSEPKGLVAVIKLTAAV